ncbi:YbaN family protein [Staphylococcus agnetis]|uniref:YbaN family protein n=1 Tax=Staphylococcus agnetis TaxID=985762 RepID=A0ABD7TVI3_9STAP|nr:YbaN family protein [Staphylococcus agnetis]UXU55509.1 YbaN family protein [Staphylococcus agnetis]UXU57789.1 YbaN family protein [Staphylococcus agnetis]
MRYVLIAIGVIFTLLGFAGAVLPLLPTTPFLLVAVICFAKSSERFHNWLVQTKVYQAYVEDFKLYRGYTMKKKIQLLMSLYIVVGFSIWAVDIALIRVGLVIMVIIQTIVLFTWVRTLPKNHQKKSNFDS